MAYIKFRERDLQTKQKFIPCTCPNAQMGTIPRSETIKLSQISGYLMEKSGMV